MTSGKKVDRVCVDDGRRRQWNVDRQDLSHVIAGVRRLQGRERRDQHASTRQQHERTGDLNRGEDPQTAIRARRHPHAAASEPHTGRAIG